MKSVLSLSKISKLTSLAKTLPWVSEEKIRGFFGLPNNPNLFFVTPNANWATDWYAYYISNELKKINLSAQVTTAPHLLSGNILHYSDLGTYIYYIDQPWNKRNQIIMTFFHGDRSGRYPEFIPLIDKFLSHIDLPRAIITSCTIMKNRMLEWGVPQDKIKCIPLGIDLARFQPIARERKTVLREALGIPEDALCIGSFQKDGVGWKDGLEPKLVKGPDIFLRVVQQLKSQFKIYVLLTAPARGYIKSGLESLGIPFQHILLKKYWDVARLYQALDCYLVTSREEGGPIAMLEALACGIPLVSTRVGMVPDVIIDKFNGLTVENEDIDGLVQKIVELHENPEIAETITKNGLETVNDYRWSLIAKKHYNEVYAPLIQSRSR